MPLFAYELVGKTCGLIDLWELGSPLVIWVLGSFLPLCGFGKSEKSGKSVSSEKGYLVVLKHWVGHGLSEKHAVGHVLKQRARTGAVLEPTDSFKQILKNLKHILHRRTVQNR
jgi:hypothetical protein